MIAAEDDKGIHCPFLGLNNCSGEKLPNSWSTVPHDAWITVFTASGNALTGSIPADLSPSLRHLVLHRNALGGEMPSFRNFSSLETFSLFEMHLTGRLILPPHAPNLSVVMVQSNRLSCRLDANVSIDAYDPSLALAQNLLGPGNAFSHPALLAHR